MSRLRRLSTWRLLRQLFVALAIFPLMLTLLTVASTPSAQAAPGDPCRGSASQSGVTRYASAVCRRGGGALPPPLPGEYRGGPEYPNMPCFFEGNPQYPSHYGVLWWRVNGVWQYVTNPGNPVSPEGHPMYCLRPNSGTITQNISIYVPEPKITSSLPGRLLYNAPVDFSIEVASSKVAPGGVISKKVEGFDATLSFTAKKVTWDFGDGTTAEGMNVTHTFKNAMPDGKVKVSATVTWEATLAQGGGAAAFVGEQTVDAELTQPIVQVRATPTGSGGGLEQ